MNQKPTENDVHQVFQGKSVQPSDEWIDVTRTKLHELSVSDNSFNWKFGDVKRYLMQFSLSHNPFQMKKAFAVLGLAILAGGFLLLNQPSSLVAREKLNDARQILAQLKSFNQTGEFVKVEEPSLFPAAYADTTEELKVEDAVEELEKNLDEAIEAAEEINDPAETAEILGEIDEVQDETVEVLAETIENVEDNEVIETIAEVIEDTVAENEAVEAAEEEAEEAAENEEDTVDVDIDTEDENSDDQDYKTEKHNIRLEKATTLYKSVKADIEALDEEIDVSLQTKLDKIEKAIEDCAENSEAKTCKSGRIKGLSRALQAKIKNNARKQKKDDDLNSGSGSVLNADIDKIIEKDKVNPAKSGRENALGQERKKEKKANKNKPAKIKSDNKENKGGKGKKK